MKEQTFSVIPEVFFDIIARVVPGIVLLLGLSIAIPEARHVLIESARNPKGLPPMTLVVPLAFICAWVAGLFLSMASGRMRRLLEQVFRVTLVEKGGRLYNHFDEHTQNRLKRRIRELFGCEYEELPFWLCFDYARAYAPGPMSSAVVKSFAESTCARNLAVSFSIITTATLIWDTPTACVLPLVLVLFSCAAHRYHRAQANHRMLLSLLYTVPASQSKHGMEEVVTTVPLKSVACSSENND